MMIWFLVVLWLAIKASTACCDDRLDRPSATKLQKLDRFYGLLAAARIAEELGLDPLETALGRPQVRRRRELSAQNSLNSIRSECEREWADDLDVVHVWSHGKLAEGKFILL